jgi:hypothetical protein
MNNRKYFITIALLLIFISGIAYYIHYLLFHDLHHILIFLVGDIAFLPLEVLIVGLVIERILAKREMDERMQKLNMVIGAYFSEVGRPLATMLLDATAKKKDIVNNLNIKGDWKSADYKKARSFAEKTSATDFDNIRLDELKTFLVDRRGFLLALVENPNVLEHQQFTDLLLASFHLMEELESRPVLDDLPHNDILHIKVDAQRAFKFLAVEWLDYMQHLKANYPFLFSHYLRISPYQLKPSAVIE